MTSFCKLRPECAKRGVLRGGFAKDISSSVSSASTFSKRFLRSAALDDEGTANGDLVAEGGLLWPCCRFDGTFTGVENADDGSTNLLVAAAIV